MNKIERQILANQRVLTSHILQPDRKIKDLIMQCVSATDDLLFCKNEGSKNE